MKIKELEKLTEINGKGDISWFAITLDEIELKTHEYLRGANYVGCYKLEVGFHGEVYADPTVFNLETGEDVNFDDLFMEFAGMVEREEFEL